MLEFVWTPVALLFSIKLDEFNCSTWQILRCNIEVLAKIQYHFKNPAVNLLRRTFKVKINILISNRDKLKNKYSVIENRTEWKFLFKKIKWILETKIFNWRVVIILHQHQGLLFAFSNMSYNLVFRSPFWCKKKHTQKMSTTSRTGFVHQGLFFRRGFFNSSIAAVSVSLQKGQHKQRDGTKGGQPRK